MKAIKFNSKHVNTMNVYHFNWSRTIFTFEELAAVPRSIQQNYHVLLDESKSCSHARLDWKRYVHRMYCMESIFNVYR
ncbi:hypothetical protein AHAS_Ahas04G0019600 [Arachis hypogaea]